MIETWPGALMCATEIERIKAKHRVKVVPVWWRWLRLVGMALLVCAVALATELVLRRPHTEVYPFFWFPFTYAIAIAGWWAGRPAAILTLGFAVLVQLSVEYPVLLEPNLPLLVWIVMTDGATAAVAFLGFSTSPNPPPPSSAPRETAPASMRRATSILSR